MNSCNDFSCFYTYTHRYTIDGDTTIGGLQYAKVYVKYKYEEGSVSSQWCNESVNYYEHYFGALRESGKQVLLVLGWLPDSTEYVVYDFNLSIGDTLPSPDGDLNADPAGRIISAIDSIEILGSYRKRFVINSNKYIIEGIGASTGLFNPLVYFPSECYMAMHCYAEYETPDHFLQDCNLNLNVDEIAVTVETPVLIKIVDYIGRETQPKPNTPLIYIYSDGTTKKVFNIE
jgi:hypothetical protein